MIYLSRQVANYQEDYEEVSIKLREAIEKADRLDEYIKNETNAMQDLEARSNELYERARIAEQVHDMMVASDGDAAMKEKLIDVVYENEQLKAENSKLKQLLEKTFEFMKQFMKGEKTLFELFQEKVGIVLEKVRDGLRR